LGLSEIYICIFSILDKKKKRKRKGEKKMSRFDYASNTLMVAIVHLGNLPDEIILKIMNYLPSEILSCFINSDIHLNNNHINSMKKLTLISKDISLKKDFVLLTMLQSLTLENDDLIRSVSTEKNKKNSIIKFYSPDILLRAIHASSKYFLRNLNVSAVPGLTDDLMEKFCQECGRNIIQLDISNNAYLTNATFESIARWCRKLKILICSGYFVLKPKWTDEAILRLVKSLQKPLQNSSFSHSISSISHDMPQPGLTSLDISHVKQSMTGKGLKAIIAESQTLRHIKALSIPHLDTVTEISRASTILTNSSKKCIITQNAAGKSLIISVS